MSARTYQTPAGPLYSVTTVLGIIDKSQALVPWGANCAVKYIRNAIDSMQDSCSTIATDKLEQVYQEARNAHRNIKEDAADVGSQVHDMIERWCKMPGKRCIIPSEDTDPRVINGFTLFLQWAEEVELEPLENEIQVYSARHEFAGTLDLIARGKFNKRWRKKRTYLIDFKTSNDFYESFGPQVAAYKEGYIECNGKYTIDGTGVLRLGKEDGKPEFRDSTEHHHINWLRFLAAKDAYHLWRGRPNGHV
jgi:hypothetical protein